MTDNHFIKSAEQKKMFSRGVRNMLAATFLFAMMNVFVKKVSHLPTMEIVFFRCGIATVFVLAAMFYKKISLKGSHTKLLLARGVYGTAAVYTFFLTLQLMPLGTAVTIQYLSPIFTTIIAIYLLKEKVKTVQWLFFLISFSGIIFIKGFDARVSWWLLAIGILSAFLSGLAYNMVRTLSGKENPMVVVFYFQFVGMITGFLFSLYNWHTPSAQDWFYLLLVGLCTHYGQVNLTRSLQLEKIARVSILNYLGILYALLFGFLFFDEHYPMLTITGILLVIAGVLFNLVFTSKKNMESEI